MCRSTERPYGHCTSEITPTRLGLSGERQKTPLSLKKSRQGGVWWGCCSEHPNQTRLILILSLAFVPYHIPPPVFSTLRNPLKEHQA